MPSHVFSANGFEIEHSTDLSTQLLNGFADPTVEPGVSAPISSSYVRAILNPDNTTYTVKVYDKIGPANTDWQDRSAAVTTATLLGLPTDGSYSDGLFTLTPTTKTGDAVDQINEFLSLMAPPPAPILSDITTAQSGATGKLSFDSTHQITGYSYDATTINTQVSKSGNNLGIFSGSTTINATLNNNQSASAVSAWPAKAFGPGDQGVLELWVNGVKVHSTDLSTFVSGTDQTNGSGFNLSASTAVQFSNGNSFPALKYRTGTVAIAAAAQRPGYNFAQVKHVANGTTTSTNAYFWYNSIDANAMAAVGNSLTPTMGTTRYLSGVKYYNSGTIRLQSTVNNAYADVYSASASAVTPSSTHASLAAAAIPNCTHNTDSLAIDISGNLANSIRLLNASATASFSVLHPIKPTLTVSWINSGKVLYDPVSNNSALSENFSSEAYRVTTIPATASVAPSGFDSTANVATLGGLQCYGGSLRYPTGDFRAVVDGGTIDFAPAGNPNYTGSTGNKTFIRSFQNNTGSTRANFKLNISGASTSFVGVGSVSGNSISVEMKFPQGALSAGTGWMDAYADFATGQWGDGSGCRSSNLGAGRALATDWGITVGTQSIAAGEYVYVKFTAPASWSGSLNNVTLTWL